jgi:hypothetical protein
MKLKQIIGIVGKSLMSEVFLLGGDFIILSPTVVEILNFESFLSL